MTISGVLDPLGSTQLAGGIGSFGGLLSLGVSWRRPRLGLTFLSPPRGGIESDRSGGVETVQAVPSSSTDHASRSVPATGVPRMDVGSGKSSPARPVSSPLEGDTGQPAPPETPGRGVARTSETPSKRIADTPSKTRRPARAGAPDVTGSPVDTAVHSQGTHGSPSGPWRTAAGSQPSQATSNDLVTQRRVSASGAPSSHRPIDSRTRETPPARDRLSRAVSASQPTSDVTAAHHSHGVSERSPRARIIYRHSKPAHPRQPGLDSEGREQSASIDASPGESTFGTGDGGSSVSRTGRATANTTSVGRSSSGQRHRSSPGQHRQAWQPGSFRTVIQPAVTDHKNSAPRSARYLSERTDGSLSAPRRSSTHSGSDSSGVSALEERDDATGPATDRDTFASPSSAGPSTPPLSEVQSTSPSTVARSQDSLRAPELVVRSPIRSHVGPGGRATTAQVGDGSAPAAVARPPSRERYDRTAQRTGSATLDRGGSTIYERRRHQQSSAAGRPHSSTRPAATAVTPTRWGPRPTESASSTGGLDSPDRPRQQISTQAWPPEGPLSDSHGSTSWDARSRSDARPASANMDGDGATTVTAARETNYSVAYTRETQEPTTNTIEVRAQTRMSPTSALKQAGPSAPEAIETRSRSRRQQSHDSARSTVRRWAGDAGRAAVSHRQSRSVRFTPGVQPVDRLPKHTTDAFASTDHGGATNTTAAGSWLGRRLTGLGIALQGAGEAPPRSGNRAAVRGVVTATETSGDPIDRTVKALSPAASNGSRSLWTRSTRSKIVSGTAEKRPQNQSDPVWRSRRIYANSTQDEVGGVSSPPRRTSLSADRASSGVLASDRPRPGQTGPGVDPSFSNHAGAVPADQNKRSRRFGRPASAPFSGAPLPSSRADQLAHTEDSLSKSGESGARPSGLAHPVVVRRFGSDPLARPSTSGVAAVGSHQTAGSHLAETADYREPALTALSRPGSRDTRTDAASSAATAQTDSDSALSSTPPAPSPLSTERAGSLDPRAPIADEHATTSLSSPPRTASAHSASRSQLRASRSGSGAAAQQPRRSDSVGRDGQQYGSTPVWPGQPRLSSPSVDRSLRTRAPASRSVRGRSTDSIDRAMDRSSTGSTVGSGGIFTSIRARDAHGQLHLQSVEGGSLDTRTHAPLWTSRGSNSDPSGMGGPSQRRGPESTTVSAGPDPSAAIANVTARSKSGASAARDVVAGGWAASGVTVDRKTIDASVAPAVAPATAPGRPLTERPAALPETAASGRATDRSPVRAHDRTRAIAAVEDRPANRPRASVSSSQSVEDRSRPQLRSAAVGSLTPPQSGTHRRTQSVSPRSGGGSVTNRLATPPLRYDSTASRSESETIESPSVPTRPAVSDGRRRPDTAPVADSSGPDGSFERPQGDTTRTGTPEQWLGRRSRSWSGQAAGHRLRIGGRLASTRPRSGIENSGATDLRAGHAGDDVGRTGTGGVARAASAVVDAAGHGTSPDASSWPPSTAGFSTIEERRSMSTASTTASPDTQYRSPTTRLDVVRSARATSEDSFGSTSDSTAARVDDRSKPERDPTSGASQVGNMSRERGSGTGRRPRVGTATRRPETESVGTTTRPSAPGSSVTRLTRRREPTASADSMAVLAQTWPVTAASHAGGAGRSDGRIARKSTQPAVSGEYGRSGPSFSPGSEAIAPALSVSRLRETASPGERQAQTPNAGPVDRTESRAGPDRLSSDPGPMLSVASARQTGGSGRVATDRRGRDVRTMAAGGGEGQSGSVSNTINRKTNNDSIQQEQSGTMDANVATPSLTYHSEAASGVESSESASQPGDPVSSPRHRSGRNDASASRTRHTRSGAHADGVGDGAASRGESTRRGSPDGQRGDTRPSPTPFDESRALESTKRVDPAESAPAERRDDGRQRRQAQRRDRGVSGGEVSLPDESGTLSMDADVDRVVDVLYRRLERKMRIERQRKGL